MYKKAKIAYKYFNLDFGKIYYLTYIYAIYATHVACTGYLY